MSEQPQECYGIPYAMHSHDIERIEELSYVIDLYVGKSYETKGVNSRLREGWVLLAIGQNGSGDGAEPVYIMGVPRPKFCHAYNHNGHRIQMFWRHENKSWRCKECDHHLAIEADPDYVDPLSAF